mmetsp:Transcript_22303/g.65853  ORF Transcript_22303/g.65853 Transcript_22303/m.65853 type:complete len:187 (+) Transcript_22303:955-1515(+)
MYTEMARLGLRFTNARQTKMQGTPATLELMDEVDALLERMGADQMTIEVQGVRTYEFGRSPYSGRLGCISRLPGREDDTEPDEPNGPDVPPDGWVDIPGWWVATSVADVDHGRPVDIRHRFDVPCDYDARLVAGSQVRFIDVSRCHSSRTARAAPSSSSCTSRPRCTTFGLAACRCRRRSRWGHRR